MTRARFLKLLLCALAALCVYISVLPPEALRAEAAPARGKLKSVTGAGAGKPQPSEPLPEPLPKRGNIAVLVDGWSPQHNASTAALVVQRLTKGGYKVVDQNKLAAIRQSKAAVAALDGDIGAIVKLSSQYGVGTTITISAEAGQPRRNEFGLYTGTASVAVMAVTSGGKMIFSDTVRGKQVGYTPDEAAQKAIEAAALLAVDRMVQ
jgi:hypothetical protein